jgi:mannose/fructose/N-acetylgalactosamine-specific phosphotransferase system component IIC
VSRTEFGIVIGATAGPLALIGLLMLGGHHAPDPAPPAVVKVVPYPVPTPAHTETREVLA